jgi:S-adenosylmethionine synthetase
MPLEELHTSESVTEGHPDKVCDQIAAAILDQAIKNSLSFNKRPRVAMEVSAKGGENGGTLMLFGEVTLPTGVTLDYGKIARDTIARIGYDNPSAGFSSKLDELIIRITQQSANIDHGVSRNRTGAGDQGLMFGGAVNETPELMPMPIAIAHGLTNTLTDVRRDGLTYLRPDGKAQVVVLYRDGKPVAIHRVILAASHDPLVQMGQLRHDLTQQVIIPVLDSYGMHLDRPDDQIIINGAGPWTIYGPLADAGTTNRKIIVDSYGGRFPHGGGGFNGKDPTKVDVSGACGARFVAKGLVAEKLAREVLIEVSYVIGQPDPLEITIDTFAPDETSEQRRRIEQRAIELLDLSVDGIIDGLNMFQPVFTTAAVGGFFGREIFPWEKIP